MASEGSQIEIPSKGIISFLERNLILTEGVHSGECIKFENSPWMIEPLEALDDDNYSKVTILKAAGCGGTYIAEGFIAASMATRGGRTVGYQIWTKQKAQRMASRIMKKLDAIPAFQRRIPLKNQYAKGKTEINFEFPPSAFFIQEASETAAQSDRIDYVICDEPWLYPQGRLAEFDKRTEGALPFFKHVRVSTAPRDETQDMAIEYFEGSQREYNLRCFKCDQLFFPTLTRRSVKDYGMQVIQFPEEGTRGYRADNVKMVCPSCHAEFKPKLFERRKLLEGAEYVSANINAPKWNYSCRFNAWIPWFVDWRQLVDEYLRSVDLARAGDISQLSDYFMKREADYLSAPTADNSEVFVSGDYELIQSVNPSTLQPFWHADKFEDSNRYVGVDVQMGHFWMTVIDVKEGGDMRLVWAGRLGTWEDIRLMLKHFKVDSYRVGVDIRYGRGGEVHKEVAGNGWYAMQGEDRDDGYPWSWDDVNDDGDDINGIDYLPYGQVLNVQVPTKQKFAIDDERFCKVIPWSHKRIFDHYWELTRGRTETYFGLPGNIDKLNEALWKKSEYVLEQLDSIRFFDQIQSQARKLKLAPRKMWQKKTGGAQDHLCDCFAMALAIAHIDGCFA